MLFALAKSFFDLDNYELGFKYLKKGNEYKFVDSNYSQKKQEKLFKKIINFFDQDMKIKIKDNYKFKSKPIFILGMPRAGTTLIEQILSTHSQVFGSGELDFMPISVKNSDWDNNQNFNDTINNIRLDYMNKLKNLSDNKFITDKLPLNFIWIGFIVKALPEAKIIHIERNPMATCWSNYKINFNNIGMSFTSSQENIAQYYILYKQLMDFWTKKFSEKIINIKYEDFIENHKKNIKYLIKKLNLEWEENIFNFHENKRPVETASLYQVRNKIYKDSLSEWKKYRPFLKSMEDVLKKNNISY